MTKVLLDACVPRRLRHGLIEFEVETAQQAGLAQLPDGDLLAAIGGRYDVLVTRDRNLVYQQKIAGRSIAIVILHTLDPQPAAFDALLPALKTAIAAAFPSTVTLVGLN